MSCSSFSSVRRSLGLLLRVSSINWSRSVPVESVYSTLDSERQHKLLCHNNKCPHLLSHLITFTNVFASTCLFVRHLSHTHTFRQRWFLWIGAVLLLLVPTGSPLVVMAAGWDVCVWRCLKRKKIKSNLSAAMRLQRGRKIMKCVRLLPWFLQTGRTPRWTPCCAPTFLWTETHTQALLQIHRAHCNRYPSKNE